MSHLEWLLPWACPGPTAYLSCSLIAVICVFSQACCRDCCSQLLLLCPGYRDSRSWSSKPSSLPLGHHQIPSLPFRSRVQELMSQPSVCWMGCSLQAESNYTGLYRQCSWTNKQRESLPSPGPGKQHSCVLSSTNPGLSVPLTRHVSRFPSGPPSVATCPSANVPLPATNPLLLPLCPSSVPCSGVTPQVQRQVGNRSGWYIA